MDEIKVLREEIANEFRALREEVTQLREQLAKRHGELPPIDWTRPVRVGTPVQRIVPMQPLPPGTVICGDIHG